MPVTDLKFQESCSGNYVLDAALSCLKRGWSVVPVAARAKYPIVAWKPYQSTPPEEDLVRKWFADHPDLNLSVVTGALSGIVVVDIDPRHGGETSLRMLEMEHGQIPPTVESQTGGGGRHLFFKHPGVETRNRAGVRLGIDVRGDGGVIVVPPSIHPSGTPYIWRPGHGPDERALATLPEWLLTLAHSEAVST